MEYFYHFLKFLGVFAAIIAIALFAMQLVS
jgi:hypothetical protein